MSSEAKINEMLGERKRLVVSMRSILDKAGAEKRDLSSDEQKQYDDMEKDAEKVVAKVERERKLLELETSVRSIPHDVAVPTCSITGKGVDPKAEERIQQGFRAYLSGQGNKITPEFRALSADQDTQGGYLVPTAFSSQLIKFIDDQVFIRKLATVETLTQAASLGVPELKSDISDDDWTSEIGTGSEDSSMDFGKRELKPHPLAKRIKISKKLLRLSTQGVEALVRDRMGYKAGITEEKAFLLGTGTNQPLGVFAASTDGISTGRDISTGNSGTAIGADNLRDMLYGLKAAYQARAVWIWHRDAVKQISKLKDNQARYLWEPGISAKDPDTILGRPFYMSEYAPNTFTSGKYVGILGDFKTGYWIVDCLQMEIQRLDELYAETNQVGFILRRELDGAPVLEECFVRSKLA